MFLFNAFYVACSNLCKVFLGFHLEYVGKQSFRQRNETFFPIQALTFCQEKKRIRETFRSCDFSQKLFCLFLWFIKFSSAKLERRWSLAEESLFRLHVLLHPWLSLHFAPETVIKCQTWTLFSIFQRSERVLPRPDLPVRRALPPPPGPDRHDGQRLHHGGHVLRQIRRYLQVMAVLFCLIVLNSSYVRTEQTTWQGSFNPFSSGALAWCTRWLFFSGSWRFRSSISGP